MNIQPENWHDFGGRECDMPINTEKHDYVLWEKRVDALLVLCIEAGLFTTDGLRRALEEMVEKALENHSYYERWIYAIHRNLLDKGLYSQEEMTKKFTEIQQRGRYYGEAQSPHFERNTNESS